MCIQIGPAFVTYASNVATADSQANYDIALARSNREVGKANADKTFAEVQSAQARARAIGTAQASSGYLSDLLGLQSVRRLSSANHTKTYERAFAVAEKTLGIENSQAWKQFEIDTANKVEADTRLDDRNSSLGDAKLTFATTIADVKLVWQQAEASDQQSFTTNSVPLHHANTLAVIGLDQSYQKQVAIADGSRQHVHATLEGNFILAKTLANNNQRSTTATATVGLWNASELARVDAHTAIDDVLQLPWTEYLVDAASARAAWWNNASLQYIHLATDRNSAESSLADRLATAHTVRQKAISTAQMNQSLAAADAQTFEATAKANAVRDYFSGMVTPASTYLNSISTAEHQKSVATAQAHRDYIDHESVSQRDNAILNAGNTFKSTKDSNDATYRSTLASKQAKQFSDFSTAEFHHTVALIAADVSRVTSRNSAENVYRIEESNAYLQSATSWATIDAVYRQYEANSFASAASGLASSNGSPWADYDATYYAAQAANVSTVSNAAMANAIAQALSQATVEIAQTNAETLWRNANAVSDGVLNSAFAAAHLGLSLAQSHAYALSGGNGLAIPIVSRPADLTNAYTINVPSNNYSASIYGVTSTNYVHFSPYSGYWWGAWGYYGAGNWYDVYSGYYYGYSAYYYTSYYLVHPQNQFPETFWQINTDEVTDQMLDGSLQVRYGLAGNDGLEATVNVPNGTLKPMATVPPSISDGAAYSNDEVMDILFGRDSEAGDYWALHGATGLTDLSERPSTDLGELSPELVQAELNDESNSFSDETESDVDESITTSATGSLLEPASAVEDSLAIANRLASQADATSGVTPFAQHLGRDSSTKLTPFQKLNAYLQGVNNQKGPGFFDQAAQISVNLVMSYINGKSGSLTEYAKGYAKGFFIDGAWGNVEGIAAIAKFGWGAVKQSWYNQARIVTFGNEWIFENPYFNFEDQRKVEANVIKAGQTVFKVLNAVGTEAGSEAFAHYHALTQGSGAELQELGGKHQQVAAAVMAIGVLISEKLRDMTPETRGRISGAITWEIAQTVAEIAFTAGAATVATKGAKFARIADKLADFAKSYDKLGDIAKPVLDRLRQISEPGGELRKLLEKFDEKAVVVERVVKVVEETLQNACFAPSTLVLTDDGRTPLGEVRAGQQVMAFDFTNSQWTFRTVKANLRNRYTGELVTISIGSDKIEATAEHPFWVISGKQLAGRPIPKALSAGEDEGEKLPGRWVNACDLEESDVLQSSNGSHVSISDLSIRTVEDLEVCNLSVGENHCYAVGSESVLVHNATWCGVLTEMHPGWDKIRANLAKKFKVALDKIHGHHIVQKAIPKEAEDWIRRDGKLWKQVKDLTEKEFFDIKDQYDEAVQSAWYISESQKLLKKADVEIYSPKQSGVTTDEMLKTLKEDLQSPKPGRSGANLTLALNDKVNVHNVETHSAVYKRLKAVEGNQTRTESVLREIGQIFRDGDVPTETGRKPIKR